MQFNLQIGKNKKIFKLFDTKRQKERRKDLKIAYDKLSFQEQLAYNKLMNYGQYGINWIILPIKFFVYLGLISLSLFYGFDINLKRELLILGVTIIQFYWIFILIWLVEAVIYEFFIQKKLEDKLLK